MAAPSFTLNPHRPPLTMTTSSFHLHLHRRSLRTSHPRTSTRISSSSSSSISELDLYDLLGIDNSSDLAAIKAAYRALQKRCHPDIAGPAGHDMAIILNEAYRVLSDEGARSVYDKKHRKTASLRGYTGKPIYSSWFGLESEQRAVFVDEVRCVGCLKCALLADKTFAIESAYGRARVVAQWADREDKILDAIDTCPVNCISIVERSDLAALEFLMSKQPRGSVRMGVGNTVGRRVSDVFNDVEVFQRKYKDATKKVSSQHSDEADLQRNRRISAIQAIRAISNWLYWQTPNSTNYTDGTGENITIKLFLPAARSIHEPNLDKLRNAAEARKQSGTGETRRVGSSSYSSQSYRYSDEYWVPSSPTLPSGMNNVSTPTTTATISETSLDQVENRSHEENVKRKDRVSSPLSWGIPYGAAIVAAIVVGTKGGEGAVGGIEEHIGGRFALEIVNSSWSQMASAAVAWYAVGLVVSELIVVLRGKGK
ncbi:Chaperone protein dnaJ C76, chloroplastic-like protein [Drosera capensis]